MRISDWSSDVCSSDLEFLLYQIAQEMAADAPGLSRRAVPADVRDSGRLALVMAEERPELVFHAAALKHVPMAEAAPPEPVLNHGSDTPHVAQAAREAGVPARLGQAEWCGRGCLY